MKHNYEDDGNDICWTFARTGTCHHGQSCQWLHQQTANQNREEIDNSICWEFNSFSGCKKGKKCTWKHVLYGDANGYDNEYDEWSWDINTNQATKYKKIQKKIKLKKDPETQKHQKTMKIVNRIKNKHATKQHNYKTDKNIYIIIVINSKQLYVGSICKDKTKEIYSKCSKYELGKHNKGGCSQQRFERIYENKISCFIKECTDKINQILSNNVNADLVIIGGNGTTKTKLISSIKHNHKLKNIKYELIKTKNGGKNGFDEIFHRLKNERINKYGMRNKKDMDLIEEVMEMVESEDKCDMISIGIAETIKVIKLKIVQFVVVIDGIYKYVIKKKSKAIRFVKNDLELNEIVKEMNIDLADKKKKWRIVEFMDYINNLCRINNVTLNIIANDCHRTKKFSDDVSGCVGVLYQSSQYLLDDENENKTD